MKARLAICFTIVTCLLAASACSSKSKDAASPSTDGGKPASLCAEGEWPVYLDGTPKELTVPVPSKPDSVLVWRDANGFHVRRRLDAATAAKGAPVLTVTIVSATPWGSKPPTPAPKTFQADIAVDKNRAVIQIPSSSDSLGVNFSGCSSDRYSLDFTSAGLSLKTDVIFVGKTGTAFSNPLDIQRS